VSLFRDAQNFVVDERIAVIAMLYAVSFYDEELRKKIFEQNFGDGVGDTLRFLQRKKTEYQSTYCARIMSNELARNAMYVFMVLLEHPNRIMSNRRGSLSYAVNKYITAAKKDRVFATAIDVTADYDLKTLSVKELLLLWDLLQLKAYGIYYDISNPFLHQKATLKELTETARIYDFCEKVEGELLCRKVDFCSTLIELERAEFNERIPLLSRIVIRLCDAWCREKSRVQIELLDEHIIAVREAVDRYERAEVRRLDFLRALKKMQLGLIVDEFNSASRYDGDILDGYLQWVSFEWCDKKKEKYSFMNVTPAPLQYLCCVIDRLLE